MRKKVKRLMSFILIFVLITSSLTFTSYAEPPNQNFDGAGVGDKGLQSYTLNGVTYTTNDSGGLNINVVNDGNLASGGDLALGYRSSGANTTTEVSFKSSDGLEFKLNSFVISTGLGDALVTIKGYRDNVEVASSSINTLTFTTFDVSGNANWQYIDEVRMLGADLDIDIDDLYFSPAVPPTYTVTYNGNENTGGSAPTDGSSPYLSGDTVTVLGNAGTLTKTGYSFAGWNTAANGSGTSRAPGDTFAMGASNVTLYAQWTANNYSVTYNGNTNTGGSVPTDGNAYHITDTVTVLGNTGSLVKTGYTFAGWNTAANGSGTSYSGGNTFAMGSSNITLYAQWVENTYSVTYNGNGNTGGAVPTDATSYHNGDTATVLGNTGNLSRTGYTFAGWNTMANGSGTSYTGGDTFGIGLSNVTLYAQWTANNYSVTYNGNTNTGGSVPTDGNTYHITDTVTVLGNTGTLVKTGYTFAGWNTAANGSGTSYSGGNTFAMGSSHVTLYAQWTENTYSVTYNGNGSTGGAVPTDATSYHNGDTATVLGNTGSLSRTGYTFAGWNTAANGSGTGYTGGDTFGIGLSNVTLYAQWTVNNYSVTYNGNTNTGGSVPTDGNTYHITDTVTVLGNTGTLVKTGYTFAGWNTAANGSGTSYSAGNTFAMGSSNITLYAQWVENTYSVTYNGNGSTGGAVPTDATSYHNGDTATVLGNTGSLSRTGYMFAGWNTAVNGSGTSYTGGDTFAIGLSNVTLYAQWTANNYSVTYNGNINTGGSVPTDGNTYHITDAVTVLGNTGTLVKTGYTFAGWNTAANGSGTSYSGGNTFAMGGSNVTLYAQWIENTYSVTYHGNGSTGGAVPTDATSYHNGDTATVLGNTGSLSRTGYMFAGWNTAANGSGTSYTGGDTFAIGLSNVTLYAQWTANNYSVTYNGNTNTGGSVPTDGNTYHITDTVTVLGNAGSLVKTGYTFVGWNTAANGSGTSYSGGNTFAMGGSNVTLYAQWIENTYSVTYSGSGNTGGAVPTDATSYHNGDTATVLGNTGTLVRTGYTFAGWNTAANGSGTSYTGGDIFAIGTSNVTLYARWIENTYSVTYNGNGSTGGSVPTDGTNYHTTDLATVLGNTGTLVRTGYTFAGWNTSVNGKGTCYIAGNTFVMGSSNVILYAQWTLNKYTVNFQLNGGTRTGGGEINQEVSHGNSAVAPEVSKDNYTFSGWYTEAEGGRQVTDFTNIVGDVTYYAHWKTSGEVEVQTEKPKTISSISIPSDDEMNEAVFTDEDRAAIAAGASADIKLTIKSVKEPEDAHVVRNNLGANKFGLFLDISILKTIGDKKSKVHNLNKPITITFEIPDAFKGHDEYSVIRVHNKVATVLKDEDSNPDTITFSTDQFSTYALVYEEAVVSDSKVNNKVNSSKIPETGDSSPFVLYFILAIVSVGTAGVFSKKRSRR